MGRLTRLRGCVVLLGVGAAVVVCALAGLRRPRAHEHARLTEQQPGDVVVQAELQVLVREQNATIAALAHALSAAAATAREEEEARRAVVAQQQQHPATPSTALVVGGETAVTKERVADSSSPPNATPTRLLPPQGPALTTTWRPVALTRDDWVIYLRIQKTGSQTLWLTLVDVFDGSVWRSPRCAKGVFCGYRCAEVLAGAFKAIDGATKAPPKCHLFVRAHAGVHDYERAAARAGVPTAKVRWLAFLREPIARAVSEHAHVTKGLVAQFGRHAFGKAWDYNFTDPARSSLRDWVDCGPCRVGSSNRQTRFLAGLAPTGVAEDAALLENGVLLAAALANLRRCDYVGVLDRFEDSMLLLKETFPAQLRRFTAYTLSLHPKQQPSKRRGGPAADHRDDAAARDRLRELNRLDVDLYAAAQTLFEERWTQMLRTLPAGRRSQRFRPAGPKGRGGTSQRYALS